MFVNVCLINHLIIWLDCSFSWILLEIEAFWFSEVLPLTVVLEVSWQWDRRLRKSLEVVLLRVYLLLFLLASLVLDLSWRRDCRLTCRSSTSFRHVYGLVLSGWEKDRSLLWWQIAIWFLLRCRWRRSHALQSLIPRLWFGSDGLTSIRCVPSSLERGWWRHKLWLL